MTDDVKYPGKGFILKNNLEDIDNLYRLISS